VTGQRGEAHNELSQTVSVGERTATARATGGGVVDASRNQLAWVTDRWEYENHGFDATEGWGRVKKHTNAMGRVTTTAYAAHSATTDLDVVNVNHNVKTVTSTNPAGHVSVREFDTYGMEISNKDANNRVSEACYDGLGRLTEVFAPTDPKPGGAHHTTSCASLNAASKTVYQSVAVASAPPTTRWAVKSSTRTHLNGSTHVYSDTWAILDGFGQTVQTKQTSPAGGIIVTRSLFDPFGRTVRQSDPFHSATGAMNNTIISVAHTDVPVDDRTIYDWGGRVRYRDDMDNNVMLRRSSTTYTGAQINVTAPSPTGSATAPYNSTTSTVDAYGQTIQVVEHDTVNGDATMEYRYSLRGERTSWYPANSTNANFDTVNYLGWPTATDSNDAGFTTTTYYATGEVASSTDAAGNTTYSSIDVLGRRTGRFAGVVDEAHRLTSIVYDPAGNRGAVQHAVSYDPPGTQAVRATAAGFDAAGRVTRTDVTVYAADDPARTHDNALDATVSLTRTFDAAGVMDTETLPGVAGSNLAGSETLEYRYMPGGRLDSVISTLGSYVADTFYDPVGRVQNMKLRPGGVGLDVSSTYSAVDGRLATRRGVVVGGAGDGTFAVADDYFYDDPGNLTRVYRNPVGVSGDERECFGYDQRQRLTVAYTNDLAAGGCTGSTSTVAGGPTGYDQAYSYSAADDITTIDDAGGAVRSIAYNPSVAALGCTSATDTTKPQAPVSVAAADGMGERRLRYNCDGARITDTTVVPDVLGVSPDRRTLYGFDESGRLVSEVTGDDVVWTNLQGGATVDAATNDLITPPSAVAYTYTAGASSEQVIDDDGAVSFRFATSPTVTQLVGLNDADAGTGFAELEHSVFVSPGRHVFIYEAGVRRCGPLADCSFFDDVDVDDVFTIARSGTTVTYRRNGVLFHTSTDTSSGPVRVDTALSAPGGIVRDVVITNGAGLPSRNVYDTAGIRTLRVDPDGTTTIYLAGTEIRATTSGGVTVARSYPGGTRRGFDGDITIVATDQRNSLTTSIDTATGTIAYTRYHPSGSVRTGTTLDDRGYLGAPHDPGGLVYLQHRHHDPTTGTFVSVDPLVTITTQPYLYGNANPTTYSDPTGEMVFECPSGDLDPSCGGLVPESIRQDPTVDQIAVQQWVDQCQGSWAPCVEAGDDGMLYRDKAYTLAFFTLKNMLDDGVLMERANGSLMGARSFLPVGHDNLSIVVASGPLGLMFIASPVRFADPSDEFGFVALGAGLVSTGCLVSSPVTGPAGLLCAGVAGGVSSVASVAEFATTQDSRGCVGAGIALDVLLPSVPGNGPGELALDLVSSLSGNSVDLAC
jgi:RHS repeat-associated protein